MYLVGSIQPWSIGIASASINYPASALSPIGLSPGADGGGGSRKRGEIGQLLFKKALLRTFSFTVIMSWVKHSRSIVLWCFGLWSHSKIHAYFPDMLDNTHTHTHTEISKHAAYLHKWRVVFCSNVNRTFLCLWQWLDAMASLKKVQLANNHLNGQSTCLTACAGQDPQDTEEKHCWEWEWEASIHVSMDCTPFTQA